MERITLKGHGGFSIREGWITKGMMGIRDNPALFAREQNRGADYLGVGFVMAKAVRYWIQTAGLARTGEDSRLTPLGRLILDRDPYLEYPGTIWMLHYNIVSNREGAAVWNLFFNHFSAGLFTLQEMKETVFQELSRWCPAETIKKTLLECDCSVLLQMYLPDMEEDPEAKGHSPLADLSVLTADEDGYRRHPAKREQLPVLLVYYGICCYIDWMACTGERADGGKPAVGAEYRRAAAVAEESLWEGENSPGRIFGLASEDMKYYLEALIIRGYLRVDREERRNMVSVAESAPHIGRDILQIYYDEETGCSLPERTCRKSGRRYELARQYNQRQAVTRYFEYVCMTLEQYMRLPSARQLFEEHFSDGKIVVVSDGKEEDWDKIAAKTAELAEERLLVFCGISGKQGAFPAEGEPWYFFHEARRPRLCKTRHELQIYLSGICHSYYDRMPVINHELINRNRPILKQRRARERVADSILKGLDRLSWLQGSSLEASIYRATLTATGLECGGKPRMAGRESLQQGVPDEIREMIEKIQGFILSASEERRSFRELYSVLQGRHFGMRNGVLPIYLSWCIVQVPGIPVIYAGSLEQKLDAAVLGNIDTNPAQYFLFLEADTSEKREYLLALEEIFDGEEIPDGDCCERLYNILDRMKSWYQGLTLYARSAGLSEEREETAIRFRRLLQRKYINPREFIFEELPELFQTDSFAECAGYIREMKGKIDDLFPTLVQTMDGLVKRLFGGSEEAHLQEVLCSWWRKNGRTAQGIVLGNRATRLLVTVRDIGQNKEKTILNALSNAVLGICMEDYKRESVRQFAEKLESALAELREAGEERHQENMLSFSIRYAGGERLERKLREEEQDMHCGLFYNQVMNLLEEAEGPLERNQQMQVLLQVLWEVAEQ